MKIGLITFHRAENYGAALQSAASIIFINNHKRICELIDFYPNNVSKPSRGVIKCYLRKLRDSYYVLLRKPQFIKKKRFLDFYKEYYIVSDTKYYGDDEIRLNPPNYDVLISGSDQILNTTLTGCSKSYYLSFSDGQNKISYASSFGRTNLSDDEKTLIQAELPKFSAISVREKNGVSIIGDLIGVQPTVVLDPVFLLDKEEWSNIEKPLKHIYTDYILVYTMENSIILEEIVNSLKKEYTLPVLVIRGGGTANRISGTDLQECGPSEFLDLIHHAALVVTNSFHGIAFSMIYRKKFIAISHSTRNDRIKSILELAQKEKQLVSEEYCIDKNVIDGESAYSNLLSLIESSKSYLKNSIDRL